MNNKGQALVEFVLIVPIFLIILFAIIDFGKIFFAKSTLESRATEVVDMLESGDTIDNISLLYKDEFTLTLNENGKYQILLFSTDVELMTIGLDKILENPYKIETKRVIYND
ncbi:MAG: pilus assembly protein [bacterium]|nr:pilus assembly protein [bacterium]